MQSTKRRGRWLALFSFLWVALAIVAQAFVAPSHALTLARTGALVSVPMLHTQTADVPQGRSSMTMDGGALIHAYAPLTTVSALAQAAVGNPVPLPVVMMLHGACGDPLAQCDYWNEAGRRGAWLLCPGGNVSCGDNFDWHGTGETKAAHLDEVRARFELRHGAHVAVGDDILVGFSRGAFVARDVAYARPGQYTGLVLIGAHLKPDPARLKASGIKRVVLASGDYDGARSMMVLATALLNKGGLEARFVSTGPIYHQLPADMDRIIAHAIDWIRAAPA